MSFELDDAQLHKKYYALSMQFHPDRYTLKSEEDKEMALDKSTQINKAYQTLKNKQARIKYILESLGVEFVEGKEKVPQEFLMEMMDINEELMEYKFEPSSELQEKVKIGIERVEASLEDEVSLIFATFSMETIDQNNLQVVKSYYLKTQYLNNLKNNLNG